MLNYSEEKDEREEDNYHGGDDSKNRKDEKDIHQ